MDLLSVDPQTGQARYAGCRRKKSVRPPRPGRSLSDPLCRAQMAVSPWSQRLDPGNRRFPQNDGNYPRTHGRSRLIRVVMIP